METKVNGWIDMRGQGWRRQSVMLSFGCRSPYRHRKAVARLNHSKMAKYSDKDFDAITKFDIFKILSTCLIFKFITALI